jgi:hypothetical protein
VALILDVPALCNEVISKCHAELAVEGTVPA